MPVRKILGTAVESNTITSTQLTTTLANQITNAYGQANAAYSAANTGGGPKVRSLIYPGNDTAANTIGGQTMYITGSGFAANAAIYINGAAVPSQSFISASNISFTTPNLASATYPVYLINPEDGATAILIPGILISGEPAWVTAAGSLSASQDELAAWSYNLSATGDTPITYALAAGNTLPTGVSLAANGLISGTITSPTGNVTTYTFSVIATDAQNQDSTRQFTVTTSTSEGVLFANNVLLIHADGTNNQNNHTFLDSSNNNYTITRDGNATQGSFSPFSQTGWSNFFDGVDDNLSISAGSGSWADFGSGAFTIEAWIFPRTVSVLQGICGTHAGGTNTWQLRLNSATLEIFGGGGGGTAYAGGSVAANTWTHVAVSRSGTNVYVFVNGSLTTQSVASGDTFPASTNVTIGNLYSSPSAYWFNGYISNLRILKGTALYTSTFTVPSSPLTDIANTQLLTCQSNRFFDSSTNARAITIAGAPSVQAYSPFAPTDDYTTANVGGSGYFDGTGDGIAMNLGTTTHSYWNGDFTLEYWVKTTGTNLQLISTSWNDVGFGAGSYGFEINSSGRVGLSHSQSSGTNQGPFVTSGSTYVNDNAWHHVVYTQVAGSPKIFRIFVDGILRGYKSETTWTQNTSNIRIYIAQQGPDTFDSGGRHFTGHISGYRLSNTIVNTYSTSSSTLGTSIFSPPTAPPTKTANTIALLNFTNAGIFDQTAKNVLECIGDAKVSTAQYKYGTGSMYFDGTGDRVHTGPSNPLIALGTGNFTVECWVNKLDTNHRGIWQISSTAGGLQASTSNLALGYQTGVWQIYRNGNSESASYSITPNTWYHTAVVRNSGTTKLYVNGTEVISVADTNNYTGTYMVIGGYYDTSYLHNGYIDDLRITRGYARYTANFTAPTSAFKDK